MKFEFTVKKDQEQFKAELDDLHICYTADKSTLDVFADCSGTNKPWVETAYGKIMKERHSKKRRFEMDDYGGMSEVKDIEFIYPDLTVLHLKNGMCVGISSESTCIYKSYDDVAECNPIDCMDVYKELQHG